MPTAIDTKAQSCKATTPSWCPTVKAQSGLSTAIRIPVVSATVNFQGTENIELVTAIITKDAIVKATDTAKVNHTESLINDGMQVILSGALRMVMERSRNKIFLPMAGRSDTLDT